MGDIYGATMEHACRVALLAHTGWNEPPELYFAYQGDDHIRLSATTLITTVALRARAAGHPPYTPGELLAGIASVLLDWDVRAAAPDNLVGVALYSEVVRVAREPGDIAEADQVSAYTRDRKLWTHPKAIQVRECYGLESGQPLLVVDLPREGGQIETVANMTGAVAAGLRAIASAVVPNYQERN